MGASIVMEGYQQFAFDADVDTDTMELMKSREVSLEVASPMRRRIPQHCLPQ